MCPDDYTLNTKLKLCYKLHNEPYDITTWRKAEKICQRETEDGRLVILDSQDKHLAVVKSLKGERGKLYFVSPAQDRFVGAERDSPQGEFRWTDGQLVDRIPWCQGEPRGNMCGSLWAASGFCMDDAHCGSRMRFICEKPME